MARTKWYHFRPTVPLEEPALVIDPAHALELAVLLSEFARTLTTEFPIQGILDHLVRRIPDVLPVDSAGVTLISGDLNPQYVSASSAAALRFEQLQTELGEGPCLEAYRTGAAVVVPDLHTEERWPVFIPRALDAGLAATFTFPLRDGDKLLGALDLYRRMPGTLDEAQMATAQTLADVASAYLHNAQSRAELKQNSLHDAMTALPNRVLLSDRLTMLGARADRYGFAFAVLFCDLDRFKEVNDTYGHQVGDDVLITVARRLESVVRPTDTVARLGGDEFVIACESQSGGEEAMRSSALNIGARIQAAVGQPIGPYAVELGVSIGVAVFTVATTPEAALHAADMAMYRAKREGGISVLAPVE